MMPARRALCSGSPFFTAPARTSRSAWALIVISPVATASRTVTGFSPTSTMRTSPRGPTCDRRLFPTVISLRQVEGQALERNRQIHALQLDVVGHLDRARREVQDSLDARADHLIDHRLRVLCGHGDHADIEAIATRDPLEVLHVVDRDAAARLVADLLAGGIEERRNLEAFFPKARIIRQGEPEVPRAHDRHVQAPIESEDLAQMPAQVLDVIADAADAELAKVREILPNLRGIELELFGEHLRRDRVHARDIELVQTPKIHRQAIGGELRHLVGRLPALVRSFHKVQCYHHARWWNRRHTWRTGARSLRSNPMCPRPNRPRNSPSARSSSARSSA